MGAYIQYPIDSTDSLRAKFFRNPSPLNLLLDITTENIIYKSFEVSYEYEENFPFILKENFLITQNDSITDSLKIISVSMDSIVVKNTKWNESYAVFKKVIPNKTLPQKLASKMFQLNSWGFTDSLEIINDSIIFPINIFSYAGYEWDNYKGINYLRLFGNSSIPIFLDSAENGSIYFTSYYNTKEIVQLKEVANYKRENLKYLYGDWIETKSLIDGKNIPPPPLADHLNPDDLLRKLQLTKDSLKLTHWGYTNNDSWHPNMTNKYIHFSKGNQFTNHWKIIKSSEDSLILEMGNFPVEEVTFTREKK
jgi:hypothetical protein